MAVVVEEVASAPAAEIDASRRTPAGWLAWALLIGLAVVFLLNSSPWLAASFGESHDGRNAAVWGMASRSIREDGVMASRFGGRSQPGCTYANHPPLIIGETVVAELVAGERPLVTRAPAWLGSIVALFLMRRLLLDAGLSALAAAVGIAIAFGSAMFFVYGSMLDTPVTSLPFTLAALIGWQRAMQGRPWPPVVLGAASLLAVMAGWQGAATVGVAGTVAFIAALRRRVAWVQVVAMIGGATAGLAISLLWTRWVYGGSLDRIFGNATYHRTATNLWESLGTQLEYLRDLVPIAGPVGLIGLVVVVIARPRLRSLALVSAGAVIGYALVFHGGAEIHDYWNFGLVVPLALGAAVLVEAAVERRHAVTSVVGASVACVMLTVAVPSVQEDVLRNGLGTATLARVADQLSPSDGPALAYVNADGSNLRWVDYETGRPGLVLDDLDALDRLGTAQPSFPVLVVLVTKDPATRARLVARSYAVEPPYALAPAGAVADILVP